MMMQILTHTPGWVFVLLLALLALGFQQTKDRMVRRALAFLLPAGMIVLSFLGIYSSFGFTLMSVLPWGLGLLFVAFLGTKIFPAKKMNFNPATNSYFICGSWVPFFVIQTIFFTKYTVGVLHGMQSPLASQWDFILMMSFLLGCLSGYFVARAICLWQTSRKVIE